MGTARIILPKANFPPKLRVAAYCRVSTNATGQLSSLAMQEQYHEKHIKQNPDWIFAGVYSDIGSGTRIKGRSRFKALLSACRRGKVDMILTKSAHRFAQNTVDALKTIRMLRSRNVDIHFERENIHTPYDCLILGKSVNCGFSCVGGYQPASAVSVVLISMYSAIRRNSSANLK